MSSGIHEFLKQDRVIWGQPAAEAVAEEAERRNARRVFIVSGRTLSRKTDVVDNIKKALKDRFVGLFDECQEHTPRQSVIDATNMARSLDPDLIVSVGGGTPIDTVKVMLVCLAQDIQTVEEMSDWHVRALDDGSRFVPDVKAPPCHQIAVPTTLSAAEFSNAGGATDPVQKVKHLYTGAEIGPQTVILDPEITVHTPDWLWHSTGIRAVDHAVEGLCSIAPTPLVDGTSLQALRLMADALPRTLSDPNDMGARLACQQAAWLAGTGILRVHYGASHGIGHSLGAVTGMSHGHTSCIMLPQVMRWNLNETGERQAWIAEAMGAKDGDAAQAVQDLIAAVGQPGHLSKLDVSRDDFGMIAAGALENIWVRTNPRPVNTSEDVLEILEMAW